MQFENLTIREQQDTVESVPNGGMFHLDGILYLKDENGNAVEVSIGKVEALPGSLLVDIVETVSLTWP